MSSKASNKSQQISLYLNDEENDRIIGYLVQRGCVSLAVGIVQLYLSEKPSHKKWIKYCTGIICFVKDYATKSYYLRMFNSNVQQVWQQEMYNPFSYNKVNEFFYYFPGDECNFGLNFSYGDEAERFYSVIHNKIKAYAAKTKEQIKPPPQIQQPHKDVPIQKPSPQPTKTDKKNEKKDLKKKAVTKIEIGRPVGFVHVGGITVSQKNGFELKVDQTDSNIEEMMEQLNLVLPDLKIKMNKKVQNFVTNFINDHGGMEQFKNEMSKRPAPPPPTGEQRNTLTMNNQSRVDNFAAPQIPGQRAPPPPPLSSIPRAQPGGAMCNPAAPTPPPPPPPSMFQPAAPSTEVTSRNDLLSSIQNFSGFSAEKRSSKRYSEQPAPAPDNSLVGQLLGALSARARFLRDSSDEEPDDDWGDSD